MLYSIPAGYAKPVNFVIQVLDGAGAPTDPSSITLKIIGGSPPALLGTLAPAKILGLSGLYSAAESFASPTAWPPNQYVVRWDGVVAGAPWAAVDTLEISSAAQLVSQAAVGGAYSTEASVRNVARLLESTRDFPTDLVTAAAVRGAGEIDTALRSLFLVPFPAPYDPMIVTLNDWLAASELFENRQSEQGNTNELAGVLRDRVNAILAEILAGERELSIDPVAEPDVAGSGLVSTLLKNDSVNLGLVRPMRSRRPR